MLLFHPELPSCADCKLWMTSQNWSWVWRATGKMGADGRPVLAKAPRQGRTPCGVCPKIPDGEPKLPEYAQELNAKNDAAYWHYLQCRAVGRWPDDPIVLEHAAILGRIDQEYAAHRSAEPVRQLLRMLAR